MKKMLITLLIAGIAAVSFSDLTAGGYRRACRSNYCADACPQECAAVESACAYECAAGVEQSCKVFKEAIPPKPCCERAMVVREQPRLVEYRSFAWECPTSCTVAGYEGGATGAAAGGY